MGAMDNSTDNCLLPEYSEGRVFFSPILGCLGGCNYCYLSLRDFTRPRINECPIEDVIHSIKTNKEFVSGKDGTIISLGAWGDMFGNDPALVNYSVNITKQLLSRSRCSGAPGERRGGGVPFAQKEIIAVAVCVLLHLWRKNTLISIFVSTGVYMLLSHLI